jgi:hypothetical protein
VPVCACPFNFRVPGLQYCSPPLQNEWEAGIAMQTLERFLTENQEAASSLGWHDMDLRSSGAYIPQNVHCQTLKVLQSGKNSSHQYILPQAATWPSNDGIYILKTTEVDATTVCAKESGQFSLPTVWSQSSQHVSDGLETKSSQDHLLNLGSDSDAEKWLGSLPSDIGILDQGGEHQGRVYASGMGCELKFIASWILLSISSSEQELHSNRGNHQPSS